MRNALVPLQAIAERLGFQLSQVLRGVVCMMDFVKPNVPPPQNIRPVFTIRAYENHWFPAMRPAIVSPYVFEVDTVGGIG